jgi:hypothetical protein
MVHTEGKKTQCWKSGIETAVRKRMRHGKCSCSIIKVMKADKSGNHYEQQPKRVLE